jgi:hypothetical protein
MEARLFLYAFVVWLVFVVLAVVNGTVRNQFYAPIVGEYAAHVISTAILVGVIFAGTYIFLRILRIEYSQLDLLLIGVFWVALTVLFEFGFGHYVAGHSWEKLLADYNVLNGRLWSLVLVADLLAPLLMDSLFIKK